MKKIISTFIVLVILTVIISGCSMNKKEKIELDDVDLGYIDTVYNYLDNWDYSIKNSGETWSINKVAFFDFDGTGRMCFYTLYPVTEIYGWGYFISNDSMSPMKFGVYDTEEVSISRGWVARTSQSGTDWDSSASKEEKYEKLKEAYLYFKEHNIYK